MIHYVAKVIVLVLLPLAIVVKTVAYWGQVQIDDSEWC